MSENAQQLIKQQDAVLADPNMENAPIQNVPVPAPVPVPENREEEEGKPASQPAKQEELKRPLFISPIPVVSTCNCRKSKCLKLYCECFNARTKCVETCRCIGCQNTAQNQQRNKALWEGLLEEGTLPKKQGGQRGCNCKKSGCLKKYCECFNAGIYCTDQCKCEECKNGQQEEKQPPDQANLPQVQLNGQNQRLEEEKERKESEQIQTKIAEVVGLAGKHEEKRMIEFLEYLLSDPRG